MCCLNIKEVRADLNGEITDTNIDLSRLVEESRTRSRQELVKLIEAKQEEIIQLHCGPKHSRGNPYTRGSSYKKKLITPLGTIRFRVQRIIHRQNRKVLSPILEALDVKRRKYSRGVRMACAEYASKMSYGDAALEYLTGTGVKVPKRTIHTWVKELAPRLLEAYKASRPLEEDMVMGDSTSVRGLGRREMNHVKVLISRDGALEDLWVNDPWPNREVDVLVSDDEPGLPEKIMYGRRQLCILHGLKRLGFILWRTRVGLEERREALEAVKRPLFTLVWSVERHRLDGDRGRLRWRIEWTLDKLGEAAMSLRLRGYMKAARFLERHAGFMVTFAELALEGVVVPYSTNRVERVMGEVAKRCKNRWMHWNTEGLRSILIFVLVRYSDVEVYEGFKKGYICNQI